MYECECECQYLACIIDVNDKFLSVSYYFRNKINKHIQTCAYI